MTGIYSGAFWKDAIERALTTLVQTVIAVALTGGVFDLATLDWGAIGAAGISAAVLSIAKSIAAANVGVKGTASLTKATLPNPREV